MKFGLDTLTIVKIQSVFKKYPEVEEVLIYGSRAKGNYLEGSGIDFTLKGKNLNHKVLSSIEQEIDELNIPYLIEISIFEKLQSFTLVDHIELKGKVFYQIEEKV